MQIAVLASCWKCLEESGRRVLDSEPLWRETLFEMNDAGVYSFTCENGHPSVVVIQEHKFQLLFDLGAMAILDGYTRESVATLTSALEQYYEFFIRVVCHRRGIDRDTFNDAYKQISNQSERRLGAYVFLYTVEHRRSPAILPNKLVAFRNRVIHKGSICSRLEAVDYGQHVMDLILDGVRDLNIDSGEAFHRVRMNDLQHYYDTMPKESQHTTTSIPTILGRHDFGAESRRESFDQKLVRMKQSSFYRFLYRR